MKPNDSATRAREVGIRVACFPENDAVATGAIFPFRLRAGLAETAHQPKAGFARWVVVWSGFPLQRADDEYW